MKASTALKRVKTYMLQGSDDVFRSRFICDNVDKVVPPKTADRITAHITNLLDGHFSLHEWLIANGHLNAKLYPNTNVMDINGDYDEKKMQHTRMLWIDDMIAHFKAKGD